MENLSVAQKEIVCYKIGEPMQVLAAAGSGKTRVLTMRIQHIIENTKKDGVIALTYNNLAADEMRARLSEINEIEERCWIGTIHSFAKRILEQYANTIGLPSDLHIYDREQDLKTIFVQTLREESIDVDEYISAANGDERKNREKMIREYLSTFAEIKRELLTEEEAIEKFYWDQDIWQKYQTYQNALINSGGIDFEDILVYAHRILLEQPWCAKIYRTKYKHICIDEAQDMNRVQYEFIKSFCGTEIKSILVVGDSDQMIYGFNGSSHKFFTEKFRTDFQPIEFKLKENFRSSKAVIHLANKLKPDSQKETAYVVPGIAEFHNFQNEESEANWICDKISALLQMERPTDIENHVTLASIVVLARNRFVLSTLGEKLEARQIPYFLKKSERQAAPTTTIGRVFDLAIRLRLNPKDWIDGKNLCKLLGVPAPVKWGVNGILAEFAENTSKAKNKYADLLVSLLLYFNEIDLDRPNLPKIIAELQRKLKEIGAKENSPDVEDIQLSIHELQEFNTNWVIYRLKGLGETLAGFRNALALGQIFNETTNNGLMLSTIHTMKGLEADIVFLMGMCEGVFPDYRAKTQKELDEELNNAFVAVTRARRWIYITYPQYRKMPWGDTKYQSPSRFIGKMQS